MKPDLAASFRANVSEKRSTRIGKLALRFGLTEGTDQMQDASDEVSET